MSMPRARIEERSGAWSRCQRPQRESSRLTGAFICFSVPLTACFLLLLMVCAAAETAIVEDGNVPAVLDICNLAHEQPMYCTCSSEHFEADTSGMLCYVSKPLTASHPVFQALQRRKALVKLTFADYGQDYRLDFVPTETLRQLGRLERFTCELCNLGILHSKAFYKLSALAELRLDGNNIIDLQKDAIAHLPRLEQLSLGENLLLRVKAGWFSRLPVLTALFLDKNKIEFIEDLAFSELGALQELVLGDNNIPELTNRTFKGLAQLTSLDLYRNELKRLDAGIFVSMPLLEVLNLKLNEISVVDPLAFDGLARLHTIFLESNHLRILPADMFMGAPNLISVDLAENHLVTLTWRTVHNLKFMESGQNFKMRLTGNKLTCDCRLAWILRLENTTESENFRRELRHVSCDLPAPKYSRSKVTRLTLEELGCPEEAALEPDALPPPPAEAQPEEESTSHGPSDKPEVESKTPPEAEKPKKQDAPGKTESLAPKDKPASSAPPVASAVSVLIVSLLLCCCQII